MSETSGRPNILVFLVDQVCLDYVLPGHPCQMPNVRRVMDEGLAFTRAFTPSPHCCPSRATFMTGLYPSRHGVFNNVENNTRFQAGLNPGVRCFSEPLREAGYRLAYSGKWHVSNVESPADRGFEEVGGEFLKHRLKDVYAPVDQAAARPAEPARARAPGEIVRPGWGPCRAFGHVMPEPDAVQRWHYYQHGVRQGLEALPKLARDGKPWCMVVSTDMVHASEVPKAMRDLYDPEQVKIPESFADEMLDKPCVYRRMRNQLWGQLSLPEVKTSLAHYYALCSLQDHYFGLLLDALEATGQANNTLVLFLADHGDFGFAHGLIEIGIPSFREVYNIPAVMRWPNGIKNPGRTVEAFVSLADFAPTFMELAGCPAVRGLTGRSLAPFLAGHTPADWPDAWYSQSKGNEVYYTQRIVQTARWKYACNWFDFDELYDLEHDPHEMNNLAFPDGQPQEAAFSGAARRTDDQPWPRLPPELDAVRRQMLGRLWRFARAQEDVIFSNYPPTALAPYGPLEGLRP